MNPLYSDNCLAFQIEGQDIKGRIIRLGDTLDTLLKKHDYPDAVSQELGKAMALSAMLGSMMKYDGILTLQITGDGIIKTLVSDYATDGSGSGVVRGYCGIAAADIKDIPTWGSGQLMITIDQGQYMDRYQGIVKIIEGSLKKSAEEYFRTSEQLPTHIMLSCERGQDGRWTAAAIMIQHLARNSENSPNSDQDKVTQEDQWNTATILLSSIKTQELVDRSLSLQDLLLRLYHDSGVRIFTTTEIRTGCRCSDEKLRTVLTSLNPEELKKSAKDGIITITCEFCKTDHKFELKNLIN